MNPVHPLGHPTNAPKLRQTPPGKPVTALRMATNEYAGQDDAGAPREHVEFHSVTVWGPRGEAVAKHLAKGRQVLVEGALRTRSWELDDGSRRYRTDVLAARVDFLSGSGRASEAPPLPAAPAPTGAGDVDPSDIPSLFRTSGWVLLLRWRHQTPQSPRCVGNATLATS